MKLRMGWIDRQRDRQRLSKKFSREGLRAIYDGGVPGVVSRRL